MAESDLFAEHIKRHLIRIRRPEDLNAHLIEMTVRVFCNISMRGSVTDYPLETQEALQNMRDIADWIRGNMAQEGFLRSLSETSRTITSSQWNSNVGISCRNR